MVYPTILLNVSHAASLSFSASICFCFVSTPLRLFLTVNYSRNQCWEKTLKTIHAASPSLPPCTNPFRRKILKNGGEISCLTAGSNQKLSMLQLSTLQAQLLCLLASSVQSTNLEAEKRGMGGGNTIRSTLRNKFGKRCVAGLGNSQTTCRTWAQNTLGKDLDSIGLVPPRIHKLPYQFCKSTVVRLNMYKFPLQLHQPPPESAICCS